MRVVKGTIIFILMCLFSLFYFNLDALNCAELGPILMGTFMVALAYLAYIFYGFPKFKPTPIQVCLIRGLIAMLIVYFLAIYVLGAFAGFDKIVLTVGSVNTIIISVITIVATEVLRYITINGNRDTGMFSFLTTLGIIMLQTVMVLDVTELVSGESIAIYLVTIFTPLVLRNLLLTVYSHHISFRLALIYALIMMEYRSVVPFVPALGEFTYCYADIMISFLALIMAYRVISKNYEGYSMISLGDGFSIFDALLFVVFFSLGTLISGVTPLQIYAAQNTSNTTTIAKGDGPVVLKGVNEFDLEKGNIILYKTAEGEYKICAVKEVKVFEKQRDEEERREVYITTDKGDSVMIDNKRIHAKVLFNMKYLFLPAIYINNSLSGGSK